MAPRFSADFLDKTAGDPNELVDDFDDVDRGANGPGLVGVGPGDSLPDPPGGVSRELVPPAVFNLSAAFIRPMLPSWMRSRY